MDIEDEYDVRSTFFWLVNQGKGTRNINNADYNFKDNNVQRVVNEITSRGWTNGLHKSAGKDTFENELKGVTLQPSEVSGDFHISIDGKD